LLYRKSNSRPASGTRRPLRTAFDGRYIGRTAARPAAPPWSTRRPPISGTAVVPLAGPCGHLCSGRYGVTPNRTAGRCREHTLECRRRRVYAVLHSVLRRPSNALFDRELNRINSSNKLIVAHRVAVQLAGIIVDLCENGRFISTL